MSKPFFRSFAAGEIAEELYGRVDLTKRQTGLALCKNFWVLPHGPAQNCPGFKYVLDVKDSTNKVRLRGFSYSDTQTMILEIGAGWIRFKTGGGSLLESNSPVITAITQANPGVVTTFTAHGFTNGQTVFLDNAIGGMTQLRGRFVKVTFIGANTFSIQDLNGANINTTGYGAYTAGGTTTRIYEIANSYAAADLFDLVFTQKADVMTITHPNYPPAELKRLGATNWTLTNISFNPLSVAPTNYPTVDLSAGTAAGPLFEYAATSIATGTLEESFYTRVISGNPLWKANITAVTKANPGVFTTAAAQPFAVGDAVYVVGVNGMVELNDKFYKCNTVIDGTHITLKDEATGVPLDTTGFSTYTSAGTAQAAGGYANFPGGANLSITPVLPAGAARYNVYKKLNGLYGYIGQALKGWPFIDNNITPDMSRTPPIANNLFGAVGDYPGAVGYYEGRRAFAGTNNNPLQFVATQSGTESNITFSIPAKDSDTIQLNILSSEAQRIRHIIPLDVLVLLTALGEWKVFPQNSDVLTPKNAVPKRISAEGASKVQPVIAGSSILFPAAQGGRVRELKYKTDANFVASYMTTDISIMAPHLFDGHTILDAAYARSPIKMAFFVRDDGVLIGLTYLPEQEVVAWWQRTTDGLFESVATVLEGNETVLYAVVNHQGVRRVEQMSTRRFATLADSYFMDSGATYSGAPISTISNGLWHLETKTVSILADGAVHAQKVVTNGSVTLDQAASKVQIGLPIVADFQTLPCAIEGAPAAGQANVKSVNEAWIRVKDTSNLKVGPDFVNMRALKQRTNEPYGSPPKTLSGVYQISIDGAWGQDGAICIRQDQPLPITISALALGVRDGG